MIKPRTLEMIRLRKEEMLSLQEIGDLYGISRERVRQIIGNDSLDFKVTRLSRFFKTHPDTSQYSNEKLADLLECTQHAVIKYRKGQDHVREWYATYDKTEWVNWVAGKLTEYGIAYTLNSYAMTNQILTDNGARISITISNNIRSCASLVNISPSWGFSLARNKPKDFTDFYIAVITLHKTSFVIPYQLLAGRYRLYFCYPALVRPSMFRWREYEDAYQLIKDFKRGE